MALGQFFGFIVGVIGAIIGAVAGTYIFPGVGTGGGAAWGFAIGSMIGGISGQVFWPEKTDLNLAPPPQPHETRVQFSSWGMSIPIQYGSGRMAGNIIYMSDVKETIERSKHRQDGVRYYEMVKTYTATFAIAFCEKPATGWVNRIWVNNKIFVDYSVGNTGNIDMSIARSFGFFSIRMGYETQTHDSDIAAIIGAAETPAYRGICYITFVDFPIGEFSGVPNIEIEITEDDPVGWWCSDDFDGIDGALPNPSCWVVAMPLANIDSNKLKITSIPGIQTAWIRSVSTMSGDFDAQVDYSDISMGAGGCFAIEVQNTVDHSTFVGTNRAYYMECWPTNYRWVSAIAGTYTFAEVTPGPASYGKIRISRMGTTISLFRKNTTDANWTTVHIFSGASTDPMFASLFIWNPTRGATTESVKFDNFLSISYGINILTGGTASADKEASASYLAGYAVDDSTITRWASDNSAKPHWWKYDLGLGSSAKVISLRLLTENDGGGTSSKDFTLQGSNNNADWTTLHTGVLSNLADKSWQEFEVTNSTDYRYYMVHVTTNYRSDNYVSFWEIRMSE